MKWVAISCKKIKYPNANHQDYIFCPWFKLEVFLLKWKTDLIWVKSDQELTRDCVQKTTGDLRLVQVKILVLKSRLRSESQSTPHLYLCHKVIQIHNSEIPITIFGGHIVEE